MSELYKAARAFIDGSGDSNNYTRLVLAVEAHEREASRPEGPRLTPEARLLHDLARMDDQGRTPEEAAEMDGLSGDRVLTPDDSSSDPAITAPSVLIEKLEKALQQARTFLTARLERSDSYGVRTLAAVEEALGQIKTAERASRGDR